MEYRNKAWSYVLHINYHFVCLCGGVGGGGGILKKTKMHTTGISNMGSFSHTCQKEHPRRNGNFRDSIIFRKHCVWLEFAWCTRYDICHIQTAQSNLLHYYLSCFPFQIVRFYKHGCWHLATTYRDLCSGFPIFPSWILAYQ